MRFCSAIVSWNPAEMEVGGSEESYYTQLNTDGEIPSPTLCPRLLGGEEVIKYTLINTAGRSSTNLVSISTIEGGHRLSEGVLLRRRVGSSEPMKGRR
jgi:hypothetical protein